MSGIGVTLRQARLRKRLTQRQVGALVGAGLDTVNRWERDLSAPRPDSLRRLCGALGFDVTVAARHVAAWRGQQAATFYERAVLG